MAIRLVPVKGVRPKTRPMWLSLDWNAGDGTRGLKNVKEPRSCMTEEGAPIRSEVRIVKGFVCGGYGFHQKKNVTIKDFVAPVSDNPIGAYPTNRRARRQRKRFVARMDRIAKAKGEV